VTEVTCWVATLAVVAAVPGVAFPLCYALVVVWAGLWVEREWPSG
jgi:hypothetical protein